MSRLIVEDGGKRRRFRLNPGRLTIGSSEQATLTLAAQDVAEIHAELELAEGRVVLRPRPGVAPVTAGGKRVHGQIVLRPGVKVRIGGATLGIEVEAPAPAKNEPAARPQPVSNAPRRPRSVVDRPRRRMQRGPSVPSWLIVVLLLAGAGGVYLALQRFAGDVQRREFSPEASDARIRTKLADRDYRGVLRELEEKVDPQEDLDADWKKVFDGHRREALALKAQAEDAEHNSRGNPYFQTQLANYVDHYLKDNGRPEARVLLQRIAWFRERYPTHPQIGWCDRMERRYAPIADMASPPTLEDLEWEVKTLTWAKPRNYRRAFDVMNAFLQTAGGGDRARVETLMQEKADEQSEYFEDRLLEAKYQWEKKKNYGQSIEELVQLVLKLADQSMIEDAAGRIVASPGVETTLAGYRNDRPEDFQGLIRNKKIRAFCEEKGIL